MNLELRCTKRKIKCVRFKRLILVMKTSLFCLEQGWSFNFELSHVLSILITMSPGTFALPKPRPHIHPLLKLYLLEFTVIHL